MQPEEAERSQRSNQKLEKELPVQFVHCPFLGTEADPGMALPFATDENRCFSAAFAVPVSTIHQQKYCLTAQYGLCPVYRQAKKPLAKAKADPVPVALSKPAAQAAMEEVTPIPVGERVAWLDADDETLQGMNALFGVKSALPPSSKSDYYASPKLPIAEQTHPDFTAHQGIYLPPQPFYQNDKFRRVVLILLLVALASAAWWLFSNAPDRPGFLQADSPIQEMAAIPEVAPASTSGGGKNSGNDAVNGASKAAPEAGVGVGSAAEATATPAAEATLTDLERIAVTATAMFANATTEMECIAPSTWERYTIEKGDTIDGLARSRGVQRELLIVANCLSQSDLEVGQTIFLPPIGTAAVTAEATLTPTVAIPVAPTRAPTFFPTVAPIQFPTPTVVIIIYPTAPPVVPPTAVPPTSAPPPESPTQVPPEPTSVPTVAPTAPPPPPPPSEPTSAPPPGEP